MKTDLKNKFTLAKIIFSLLTLTLFISACKKDWDDTQIVAGGIGIVHASPGTGALDFIVDNTKANIKDFTYTNDLGYYGIYPGSHYFGVTKKDSLKYITTVTSDIKSGSFYSIFVVDVLKTAKLLVVEDDLKAPDANKAKIRFINLSPDAPTLDLAIQGQTTSLVTGKAFKEYSSFISVDPSDNYTFQLKQSSDAAVTATLPSVKIEKGKIYTLWAKGLKGKTDSTSFGLKLMSHN